MCTVSFVPTTAGVCIAHNRDEKKSRPIAAPPSVSARNGIQVLSPADGLAGGTWIGCNELGAAAALLNGAFIAHANQGPYRMSRGLILLDMLASANLTGYFKSVNLTGIEPFTVVIWEDSRLTDARWDGNEKFLTEKDATHAHTWSSVTLYDTPVQKKRQQWFDKWRLKEALPDPLSVSAYHLAGGEGNPEIDLRMERSGFLTVSHTLLLIADERASMQYTDLRNAAEYMAVIHFTHSSRARQ
ncbi:MAG: NRDE family protein [Bacteroidota bacterium]|nr:NRDE family protein [Bacteroidota bacterium]